MAGKRRAPVEEEDFSDDEDDYEEDFGDDEEAGARGGDDEFDEEEDDELEAEMAALESIRRDKAGAAGGPDKAHINNKPGLKASIEDFGWMRKAKWIDHMTLSGEKHAPHPEDINDDLARETHFYEQALATANAAIRKLKDLGVATRRPDDFYAEMVKSDEHMKRVRAELIFEQTSLETREERRKAREQKRYGKQVQAEKLKERTLQKKESIKSLDKWRKQRKRSGFADDGKAPEGFEDDAPKKRNARQSRGGGGQHGGASQKREFKDDKFGFGGRKRLKKQNDRDSARDMTAYKPSNFDQGFRSGKGWGGLSGPGGKGGGGRGGKGKGGRR